MSGSLLFNERVVAVQPSLVRAVGGSITRAAVLQQVHYHGQAGHTERLGSRDWVVRTYADIGAEIGLTERQVGRAVVDLEQLGLIETCQPEGHLRRKWYRVVPEHPALSETSNLPNGRLQPTERSFPSDRTVASSSIQIPKREDGPEVVNGWTRPENPAPMPETLKRQNRALKETG